MRGLILPRLYGAGLLTWSPSPMHPSETRARRQRMLGLSLGVGVLAVVGGLAIYELVLGLHLLGGAGVEQTTEDAGVAGVDETDAGRGSAGEDVGSAAPLDGVPTVPLDGVPDGAQPARVQRVVDGDTITVRVEEPGGPITATGAARVRLLNIDAPELDHPERGEDCGAVEAKRLLESSIPPGTVVWLVADVEERDRYDRHLRGVFAADGTFVNAEVVRRGWAEVVLFEPNDRFHDQLLSLEEQARDVPRGAWAACGGFAS